MAYQPGKNPLHIGGVKFNSIECPSDLPIGAVKHNTAVTEYIGGGRHTQSMGVQPKQVSWEGVLLDEMVSPRIQSLRAMSVSGQEYFLAWSTEQYYCKVVEFTPTYKNVNITKYAITVEITRDANGALSSAAATSVDLQVSALTGESTDLTNTIIGQDPNAAGQIQQSIISMNQTIATAGPIAQTAGTGTNLLQSIAAAYTAVVSYSSSLSATASQIVYASRLQNVLQLLLVNVQRGQNPTSIQVQGGNLFEVASRQYGNPTLAFALAAANNLQTPIIPSAQVIQLNLAPFS